MFRLFSNLFSPDDASGNAGSESGKETFELLMEEPEEEILELPKPVKKEEEDEGEKQAEEGDEETEEDELKELEDELEDKVDEDEDLQDLVTPVRRKEILAKYPKLFKDFPYLEKAYYRDQQFTEIYPTLSDAKEAREKAQHLDALGTQVMSGDITGILKSAKEDDQEAFYRIADNYLPALKHVDQQAYFNVLGNVIKDTIITMVREARSLGEQGTPLQQAANVLNQFIFGTQNFAPPKNLARQVNPDEQTRENDFQKREQERLNTQFVGVRDDLQTRADNVLKSTIASHIDPRESMTEYVKTHASKEAFEQLEQLIAKDARFRSLLDKLWERAFQNNFSKETTDKIKSAYLSKAKTLLPTVIQRARNNALKGMGARSSRKQEENEQEEVQPASKRGPITPGRSASPNSGKIKKPSDIPRGMSTLDVLMKD